MSRLFSMTSRMSEATMLSAATATMRPMAIDSPIFSSHSAENSGWLVAATPRHVAGRRAPADRSARPPARRRRPRASPGSARADPPVSRSAKSSETNAVGRVEFRRPSENMPDHPRHPRARRSAVGDMRPPCAVSSDTRSPIVDVQLLRQRSSRARCRGTPSVRPHARSLELPVSIARADVGDASARVRGPPP